MTQKWYKKASVQTALISGAFLVAVTLIVQYSPKTKLEKEIDVLEGEIQKLETQIAPFRALAIERFGENEEEALAKLAVQVEELQTQISRAKGIIRRFDVSVATIKSDWKSNEPPDLSKLTRTASRGSDISVEIQTKDEVMRRIDFEDTSGPRIAKGEGKSRVLDYTAKAPAGSWILGLHRDDLLNCGTIEMVLYGVNHGSTIDGVTSVASVTLNFYVNGIPAYRSEYRSNFITKLSEEHGRTPRVRLIGPVPIEKFP